MKLKEAITLFGSKSAVARALGISPAAVSLWSEEKIPELRAYQLREKHKQTKQKKAA